MERLNLRLDTDDLLAAATRRTGGLTDLGGDNVWRRFCVLAGMIELGRFATIAQAADPRAEAERRLVTVLIDRLEFVADEKRYPAIDGERIERPLIVMGLAQSGAAALHALLLSNSELRAPRYWELCRPSPPPGLAGIDDAAVEAASSKIVSLAQFFSHGGMTAADCEWIWETAPHLGGYLSTTDAERYAFHRRFLQHLQLGQPGRRWVLKGALHQYRLGDLIDTYPEAVLVWVHRDPATAIASGAVRREAYKSAYYRRPAAAGSVRETARHSARQIHKLLAPTLSSPHLDAVHHILYPDLVADPVGTAGRVFEHAGIAFTPDAREVAHRWVADPANRLSNGLVAEPWNMSEEFDEYRRRFGIPSEAARPART